MKILVVDDDPDILTVAKCALEMEDDISAKCLLTGKDAVQEIKNFSPDIVLLDVMMPELDGLAVLKLIREDIQVKETPVILFTAKALHNEVEFYKEKGAQGIIVKPFDPITLGTEVKKILLSL